MASLQAQQLVQMICYPEGVPIIQEDDDDEHDEEEPEQKSTITRILKVHTSF